MKTIKYVLVSIFSCVILVGCGGKEEKKKEGFSYEKKTSETKKADTTHPHDVIITSNDLMKYNKTEIRVKAGKKVKITLKHVGKLDKKIMGHNFVLLKQGVDLAAFGNKAVSFAVYGFMLVGTEDVIASTKIIGAGETAVVEFDAPEPGEYDFLCSLPGHYRRMKGKFIVE